MSRFDCFEIRMQTLRRLVCRSAVPSECHSFALCPIYWYSWGRSVVCRSVVPSDCHPFALCPSALSFYPTVCEAVYFNEGLDMPSVQGATALHTASSVGHVLMVQELLGWVSVGFGWWYSCGAIVDRPASSFLLVSVGSKPYCLSFERQFEH